jgi:hypothetical protein
VHEEFWRSTLDAAAAEFTVRPGGVKGEITLVIEVGTGGLCSPLMDCARHFIKRNPFVY